MLQFVHCMDQDERKTENFCDRCGTAFDVAGKMHILKMTLLTFGIYRRNLCEDCKEEIRRFIDNYFLETNEQQIAA